MHTPNLLVEAKPIIGKVHVNTGKRAKRTKIQALNIMPIKPQLMILSQNTREKEGCKDDMTVRKLK